MGACSAILFGILPFFTFTLLYADVSSKYFLLLVVINLFLLYSAYLLWKGKLAISLSGRWLLGALGIVLLAQYASTFLGVFSERSLYSDIFWSSGTLFLTHIGAFALLLCELLKSDDWKVVRRTIAVSAGIFGLLTIFGVNGLGATGNFLWINLGEGSLTIGNETYAGAYLLLALIITLVEFFNSEKESVWKKVLGVSALLVFFSPLLFFVGLFSGSAPFIDVFTHPTMLLGDARASSAAALLLVGFLGGYLLIKRFIKGAMQMPAKVLWSGGLLAALILGVSLLFTSGSVVQQAYIQASTAARIIVWEVSANAFSDRPLFGWGPENYNYAFEAHFDSRVFEEKNFGEIWFERAHNVFLDTLVTLGVVGFLAFALLVAMYLLVLYRARKKGRIGEMETVLLASVVPLHLLQMQTGFDTVATYALLALFLAYALSLEKNMADGKLLGAATSKVIAAVFVVASLASFMVPVGQEFTRHQALLDTFMAKSAAEQKVAIENSLTRPSSFESLRISYASFVKGSLASIAEEPTSEKTRLTLEFMDLYAAKFEEFIAAKPESYRAHINYAYLSLLQTALGNDQLARAKEHIQIAYTLAPGHPLTFVVDSAAHLYSGDLAGAEELMDKAIAVNPDVEFTQEASTWLTEQKKTFPNISVLRITNL